MKKITVYILFSLFGLSFILTFLGGYKEIGSNFLKSVRKNDIFSGFELVDHAILGIENGWNKGLFLRSQMICIYGWIQNVLKRQIVYDSDPSKTVMLGSDGKLYFKGNVTGEDNETIMLQNVEKLERMQKFCNAYGVKFLFVIAPHKYNKNVKLPLDVKDYMKKTCDFSERLKSVNVNCLNLQGRLYKEYNNYSEGFFITDHHWNIPTAFWGFQCVVENLNSVCGVKFPKEKSRKDQFEFSVVTRDFLCSMGIRVGKYYAGADKIELVAPKYKTNFSVDFKTKTQKTPIHREGSFYESIIDKGKGYDMYITSDNSFIHVDNKMNSDGNRILLIKDSFGVPLAAWLACICDELYEIDLRYKQELSVIDMLKKHKITTLIVEYNPEMLGVDFAFDFNTICLGK